MNQKNKIKLLAEVKKLRSENEKLRLAIDLMSNDGKVKCDCESQKLKYIKEENHWQCPKCGKRFFEHDGGMCEVERR